MCVKRREAEGGTVSCKGEWDGTAMLSHGRDGSSGRGTNRMQNSQGEKQLGSSEDPHTARTVGYRLWRRESGSELNPQAVGSHSNLPSINIIGGWVGEVHEARIESLKLNVDTWAQGL